MIKATEKERKSVFLYNGLYTTSKVLLKNLHKQVITEAEYIEETRKLFDLFEKMQKGNK